MAQHEEPHVQVTGLQRFEVQPPPTLVTMIVTEDRLRLAFAAHEGRLKEKNAWHTPLGMFLTFLLALTTADPRAALGLAAEAWRGFYLAACGGSLLWLIICIVKAIRSEPGTVNAIIRDLNPGPIVDRPVLDQPNSAAPALPTDATPDK
jgi:hypothetical protein